MKAVEFGFIVAIAAGAAACQDLLLPRGSTLIGRAKSLELGWPDVPPPGEPGSNPTAGFAKIMCSAVFLTGLSPEFATENVGYFTSPYRERAKVGKPVIDHINKAVHVTMPNGITRTAKYLSSQGCVTLPVGKTSVNFTPSRSRAHCRMHQRSHGQWGTRSRRKNLLKKSTKRNSGKPLRPRLRRRMRTPLLSWSLGAADSLPKATGKA